MLTLGNKEYTDAEIAQFILGELIKRYQWIEERVMDFLSKKEHESYYEINMEYDTMQVEEWHPIPDDKMKEFLDCLEKFEKENEPYKDEQDRADYINELFSNFEWDIAPHEEILFYGPCGINIDDRRHYCSFTFNVHDSDSENSNAKCIVHNILLNDQNYIDTVKHIVNNIEFDFNSMLLEQPYIYEDLHCFLGDKTKTTEIIATDMTQDAKTIIDEIGGIEHIPGENALNLWLTPVVSNYIHNHREIFAEQLEIIENW